MQVCDNCNYRWLPCGDNYCRGYRIVMDGEPLIVGCPDCDKNNGGVSNRIARFWPEAWRAVARRLDEHKMSGVIPVIDTDH